MLVFLLAKKGILALYGLECDSPRDLGSRTPDLNRTLTCMTFLLMGSELIKDAKFVRPFCLPSLQHLRPRQVILISYQQSQPLEVSGLKSPSPPRRR